MAKKYPVVLFRVLFAVFLLLRLTLLALETIGGYTLALGAVPSAVVTGVLEAGTVVFLLLSFTFGSGRVARGVAMGILLAAVVVSAVFSALLAGRETVYKYADESGRVKLVASESENDLGGRVVFYQDCGLFLRKTDAVLYTDAGCMPCADGNITFAWRENGADVTYTAYRINGQAAEKTIQVVFR